MSAENRLTAFRMANGEFWIVVQRCGDTIVEASGECSVVAKCKTYPEMAALFLKMSDGNDPAYVYTEYGGDIPERDALFRGPPRFLESIISVEFAGRNCGCVDHRDIRHNRWRVRERSGWQFRWLGKGLAYTEAITKAHVYATCQPGKCSVEAPSFFRSFRNYPRHDCMNDHLELHVPRARW